MKITKRNKSSEEHERSQTFPQKRRKLSDSGTGDLNVDSAKNASSKQHTQLHAHQDVVYHVSTFLSSTCLGAAATKSSSTSDGPDDSSKFDASSSQEEKPNSRSDKSLDSILFLVCHLETMTSGTPPPTTTEQLSNTSVSITTEDIATLLLPWSVARLMRSSSSCDPLPNAINDEKLTNTVWRTLSCCLEILSNPSASVEKLSQQSTTTNPSTYETMLSNSFSQSTLSRLVPLAASVGFGLIDNASTNEDHLQCQKHASRCFHHLGQRYRPSLEIGCTSLLQHIEELVFQPSIGDDAPNAVKTLPRHHYSIVCGALRLIHSLLGQANPKRSFGVLCSLEVLPRFGRLAFVHCNNYDITSTVDELEERGGEARSLVERIIRDGLFHSVHHMDGFRSMPELRVMMAVPKLDSSAGEKTGDIIKEEEKSKGGGGKGCYQSAFFQSLRVIISGVSNEDCESSQASVSVHDAIATVNMLPLLIRGFFDRILNKEKREDNTSGSSQGKTTTEADSKLQFRFWCCAASPAFERLFVMCDHGSDSDNLGVALLKMTAETLRVVLEYDAYSPSYSDPDDALLSFLNFVTEGLLRWVNRCDFASSLYEQRTIHLISSIRTILLLNHRLLHERLSHCIAFACLSLRHYCHEDCVQADASTLLSTIVKIYGELRQVGYFLLSSRIAFSDMKSSNLDSESMHSLLSTSQAMKLLASTYQSCPSGQLHEIWDFFDGWVVSIIDEVSTVSKNNMADETSNEAEAAIELIFAIRMFVAFIKNIRTDKHNSPELRNLCETSMTSSVGKLLSKSNDLVGQTGKDQCKGRNGLLTRQGIDLCGWLVDLHTRSCFWIDSVTVDGNGSAFLMAQNEDDKTLTNVLSYLCDVATKTVQSERFERWKATWKQNKNCKPPPMSNDLDMPLSLRSSLLHLSMHRVHQLHSMIYYCKIQEDEDGDDEKGQCKFSSTELTNEAKILVDFALYIASSQTPEESIESASLWLPLAQSLNTWSHYAETFHSRVFLNWFFSALCETSDRAALEQERGCVLTLIRDTTFYEVKDCMSLLMEEGVMFALSKILRFIEDSSPNDFFARVREVDSSESAGVAVSCLEVRSKIVEDGANFSLHQSAEGTLTAVATIVAFLASAPLQLYLCRENIYLIDKFVGLDVLISMIYEIIMASSDSKCASTLFKILCTNRYMVSSLIPRILLTSTQTFGSLLDLVTNHMIRSSDIFASYPDISWATGTVMSELFSLCVDYHERDNKMLINFSQRMNDVIVMDNSTASPSEFASRAFLIRSVIRRMNILHRRDSFSKRDVSTNNLRQMCIDMALLSLKYLWSQIIDRFTDRETGPHYSRAGAASLLLASELLSFLGNALMTPTNSSPICSSLLDTMDKKFKQLFELISRIVDSTHGSDVNAAVHYFLSSVLTVENFIDRVVSSSAAIETVLRWMEATCIGKQEADPLLEAALCSLIREAKHDDIKFVASYLSQRDGGERQDPAFVVRIYNLLINHAKSQEQVKYLATKSTLILSTSMSLLRQGHCDHPHQRMVSNTVLFLTIMSTLIPRKEILLLSGREIAIICSEMSPLFCKLPRHANALEEVTLFKSCCLVVSSLVAHYPKKLYGCPSPLFGLLLALLNHILQSNSGLPPKALEYAKLCELLIPHKDIFKKHVLGLILRYIHALKSGMTPATKSKLMHSVYGLLDMCSDFEVRQINAMIDIPSKTLFAPVYKSYQKYYQYHGQA